MLSEILFSGVGHRRIERPDRVPGITCSQLFPCPYKLYMINKGEIWESTLTPQQILNMEDGWDQEEQSVRRLESVGVKIEDRQVRISVGKSGIPGHIDGTVTLNGKKYLWEHKAWDEAAFEWFVSKGIEYFPGQKAQVCAYMVGTGLSECIFFVKRKNNNDYYDAVIPLDKEYIEKIIEWVDRIRLDNWVPSPELNKYCAYCELNCFGSVIDFSWMKDVKGAKPAEMAQKWIQGDKLVKVGEMMKEEARYFFIGNQDSPGLIGNQDVLFVEGLEIRKIIQHRFDVKKEKVLEVFGPEGLLKVGERKDIVTYRIKEVI